MKIVIYGKLPEKQNYKNTAFRVQIPVLPEELDIKRGATFASYDILDVGEIKIPNGRELDEISWESFFPGENRVVNKNKLQPWMSADPNYDHTWTSPEVLVHYFNMWLNYGEILTLTITDTGITNKKVYLSEFEYGPSGGFGDIAYKVKFDEAKTIVVTSSKKKVTKKTTKKTTLPTTHTVKSGESLYKIAVKYYKNGSYYKNIYNANKTVIENAAKKHKKKSSQNGTYIYAGTKLKIPYISSSQTSKYYAKYTGTSSSFITALNALKISSTFASRKKIAAANGISKYSGTKSQNKNLLTLLKKGKLIRPK